MRQATDDTFGDIAAAPLAMVMFSAPWAGPCNQVRPHFESVARRYGNQIVFAEFNLDDNPATPEKYGVRQVPLFILMRRGVPQVTIAGAVGRHIIERVCEDAL